MTELVEHYEAGTLTRPTPTLMTLTNGQSLLVRGKSHTLFGPKTAGKTWVALTVVAEVLAAGRVPVWLDFEDDKGAFFQRWVDAGYVPALVDHIRVVTSMPSPDIWAGIVTGSDLVVIDSVNRGVAALDGDPRRPDHFAKFEKRFVAPALAAGSTTLALDHVVKQAHDRPAPTDAYGSVTKVDGITGTALRLSRVRLFSQKTAGMSTLTVVKDRLGATGDEGEVVGDVHFVPQGGGALAVSLMPPGSRPAASAMTAPTPQSTSQPGPVPAVPAGRLDEKIVAWAATQPGHWSKNAASGKGGVRVRKQAVSREIDAMVADGRLIAHDRDGFTRFQIGESPTVTTVVTVTKTGTPSPTGAPEPAAAPDPAALPADF